MKISYTPDSKGYYRPVYEFVANANQDTGKREISIMVDAMENVHELLGYERIKIIQRDDMLRFSLDSMLLADFVDTSKTKETDLVVDLGTGNAPIPLFLSLKTRAKIN